MQTVLTNKVANLTDLRQPGKVMREAAGDVVAILDRGKVTGYLVPASKVESMDFTQASTGDVMAALLATETASKPVEVYLQDK